MTDATSRAARSLPELPAGSRYELLFKLASGGMASVYVGRLRGAGGFWRLVAIKKAHAHLMEDRSFRRMLVEEARLASRIHHPNVVPVLDVEQVDDHLLLVMDYIEGASLSELLAARPSQPLPPRLAVRVALDACAGLHAAHELKDASGQPLHIVHRDVSPQNLLVGVDGVARLTDFGIAKSAFQGATTTTGALKGKLAYMAPEYVDGKPPDQRSDVFGLGVVIWEALSNRRLFRGDSEVDTLKRVVEARAPLLSSVAPWVGAELDPVLTAALAKDPDERFASAKALGTALEIAARRADLLGSAEEVGAHVRALFEQTLEERRRFIHSRVAADPGPSSGRPAPSTPQGRPADAAAASASDPRATPAELATAPHVVPARTAPRHLAATVVDPGPGPGASAPASGSGAAPERDASTLDGSGVSRPGWEAAGESPAPRGNRPLWIMAGVALLAGGLAAVVVSRWSGAPEPATTAGSEPPLTALTAAPVVTPSTAATPVMPTSTASPASAPPAATASSAAVPGTAAPSAPIPASSTVRKPLPRSTGSAFVPPESIPANPYATKP